MLAPRVRTTLAAAAAAAAAALLCVGCQARFERFAFTVPERPPIPIRESSAHRAGQEGILEPASDAGTTPLYLLRREAPIGVEGLAFAVSYEGSLADCTLTILADRRTVLRQTVLPMPPAGTVFRYLVPLASGEKVRGFRLSTGASSGSLQLLAAGIEPFFHGFSARGKQVTLDGSLVELTLSPRGARARLARSIRDTMAGRPWRITLDAEPRTDPADGTASVAFASAVGAAARFSVDAVALAEHPFSFHQGTVGFVPRDIRADGLPLRRLEVSFPRASGPIPADPGLILSWDRASWRQPDFELFSWESLPRVLIFDTADYRVQDRFFKRLAFFVEKAGFAGSIPTWRDLEGLHGYNAHDYRAEDLARFFSTARANGVALGAEESTLQRILAEQGVIRETSGGFEPGTGAVLSISHSSSALLRELLITHECFHGVYFSLPGLRDASARAWQALSDIEKEVWVRFLRGKSYNTDDAGLVVNEFQSYLFQQPREAVAGFQALTLSRLRVRSGGDAELVARFLALRPDSMLRSFDQLDAALRAAGGPPGGRAIAVKKLP